MNMLKSLFLVLIFAASSVSPAFSADSTSITGRDVSSQDSIPAGFVAVWPMDAAIPKGWLPCDGQAVPADCPTLKSLMAHVPNYNTQRQFLRGTTSGAGTLVADSVKSHAHEVAQHSHTVSGTASPQSFSGSASGQTYQTPVSGTASGYAQISYVGGYSLNTMFAEHPSEAARSIGGGMFQESWKPSDDSPGFATYIPLGNPATTAASTGGGTVWGATAGGSITGYTTASGPSATYAAGGAETAPAHTLVKYIIKAH